ncbi:hypothetical protein CRG98_030396 [Punica granatum]|uniref:Uncharacterized protein n=1 Tax=Punica granatum TaxID=22663 RepID=A0A2I0IYX5_PUNGR|nr:hypothetical protein CRG98_030396 [Punica granatum]
MGSCSPSLTNHTSESISETSCLSRDTPELSQTPFLTRLSKDPVQGQVNGTRERAYTHPRTTKTMEQASDRLSGLVLVSRVIPDPEKGPLSDGIQRSELIRWKIDIRVSHHSLPTTPRTWGIVSPRAKQVSWVSRMTCQWSRTPLDKPSGHIHGKQRSQRSPNTSRHWGNTEKAPVPSP